jgi:hypothetical protein
VKLRTVLFGVIITTNVWPAVADDAPPGAALKRNQPKPVVDLIDRIIDCNHWRGESSYDANRAKEIEAAMTKLRCAQLGADEATLVKAI